VDLDKLYRRKYPELVNNQRGSVQDKPEWKGLDSEPIAKKVKDRWHWTSL